MAGITKPEHVCWICRKPVELETTKTDDRGRVVHEECYVITCAVPPPIKQPESLLLDVWIDGRIDVRLGLPSTKKPRPKG